MNIRKVIDFKGVFGLTLPKEFTTALGVSHGDFFEVFLRDSKTIVLKRHGVEPKKITISDK